MIGIRTATVLRLAAGLGMVLAASGTPGLAQPVGDAERGRAAFVTKQCARCHAPRGERRLGPAVEKVRRLQGAFELAGRLWNHAPSMFALLKQEGVDWPEISVTEMADLMTYLQASPARDPTPDLFRGQVTLLRKGCLKCHTLRGEGGRIGPDLAEGRSSYESAAAWASTMWTHTPRMAARAQEIGLLYPRFGEDEMGHLVAFLRSARK